ncbi:ATP-binding protein, partial [Clostridium botulinum]|uniref:ATP-binding protein n=1 Tax=Clostridium botulinum TaxID=1491 RepID=UPI001C9B7E99
MEFNNIIFVGGIHGVGKTTLCNHMSKKIKLENYSSSDLIKNLNSKRIRTDKKVDDIDKNQNVLIRAVREYLLDSKKDYILDGHFCLINNENDIEEIPIETFRKLNLKVIIVITDNPKNIMKKLQFRDDKKYSLDFIDFFQKKEVEYAKFVG